MSRQLTSRRTYSLVAALVCNEIAARDAPAISAPFSVSRRDSRARAPRDLTGLEFVVVTAS